MGKIEAIFTSAHKGKCKNKVSRGMLIQNQGLEGDGHTGFSHRQVSLLALESILKMKDLGISPGDFAENLITKGIDLQSLPVGTRVAAGDQAVLRITRIGTECHHPCHIYYQAGDCVMHKEGVLAEVMRGGMINIGDSLIPKPAYNFAVITASDKGAAGEREDKSGPVIADFLGPWGDVSEILIIPDEQELLSAALRQLSDHKQTDAIFTTGGTGMSPRDVIPEATLQVIDRLVPGIPEALRRESALITPLAILSRGVAGLRGQTLIINLPGSPKAVRECLEVLAPILEHGLEVLTGRARECAR